MKEERHDDVVDEALAAINDSIENDENTVPAIIDAVKAYATIGEIMEVFEEQYGQY